MPTGGTVRAAVPLGRALDLFAARRRSSVSSVERHHPSRALFARPGSVRPTAWLDGHRSGTRDAVAMFIVSPLCERTSTKWRGREGETQAREVRPPSPRASEQVAPEKRNGGDLPVFQRLDLRPGGAAAAGLSAARPRNRPGQFFQHSSPPGQCHEKPPEGKEERSRPTT